MPESSGRWADLMTGGNGLKAAVMVAGVGLQALEVFVGSTVLPSVVKDIGGLDLFAWNIMLFIVAGIVATVFAAIRPFGIGPRATYVLGAATFAVGGIICGLAPNIVVLLIGRTVQGFGGGLLGPMTYVMVKLVFPQPLWPRAMALISSVWGVATLIGPAVGGIFAGLDIWRWAFMFPAPLAVLLIVGAIAVVPAKSNEPGMSIFPYPQMALVVAAVLTVSIASILTSQTIVAAALLAGAIVCVFALAAIESRSPARLLPRGALRPGTPIGLLFMTLFLMQLSLCGDVFAPFFLQRLHGLEPLTAGYVVATLSAGWSVASIITSGWTGARARLLIALGPIFMLSGEVVLFGFLARLDLDTDLDILAMAALGLVLLGIGIGVAWPQLVPRALAAAVDGESDRTAAALSMAQAFGAAMGAAIDGLIVNAAGLTPEALPLGPAQWLYGLLVAVPALAVPLGIAIVRREDRTVDNTSTQPAE